VGVNSFRALLTALYVKNGVKKGVKKDVNQTVNGRGAASPGIDDRGQDFRDESDPVVNSPVIRGSEAPVRKVRSEMFVRFFG
jgi:hypothetical protein